MFKSECILQVLSNLSVDTLKKLNMVYKGLPYVLANLFKTYSSKVEGDSCT